MPASSLNSSIARCCAPPAPLEAYAIDDPALGSWDESRGEVRDSARSGVIDLLVNTAWGPQESHEAWLAYKRSHGWSYGTVKSVERRQHPCMVEWSELPAAQRAKDVIFVGIVRSLAGQVRTVIEERVPGELAK